MLHPSVGWADLRQETAALSRLPLSLLLLRTGQCSDSLLDVKAIPDWSSLRVSGATLPNAQSWMPVRQSAQVSHAEFFQCEPLPPFRLISTIAISESGAHESRQPFLLTQS